MRAQIARLAVALALFGIAGCGGSSLSDRDLRTDAAQVCNTARFRTNRIAHPASPAAGLAFLRRGVAVLSPELAALRRLGPPNDLAQLYNRTVTEFAQTLTYLRGAISTLQTGGDPVSTFRDLQRNIGPEVALENGSWQALQIPACENR